MPGMLEPFWHDPLIFISLPASPKIYGIPPWRPNLPWWTCCQRPGLAACGVRIGGVRTAGRRAPLDGGRRMSVSRCRNFKCQVMPGAVTPLLSQS